MARLAYCKGCRATYPLNIVVSDGGRSGKARSRVPDGHTQVEELDAPRKPRAKK